MILKWLANFWLRWPRCQKPSPYPGPLMAIDADQSWNGGFTLPCMGPWMTPSPKASQKFQKTRSFWNSVNLRGQGNRLWQKGQKKSTSWTGCGYGTQTFSTQFAVWKRFWNLSKEIQQQYQFSIIAIPSNTTSSSQTMAVAIHEIHGWSKLPGDIGAHWSGPVGYSEVKHQKD